MIEEGPHEKLSPPHDRFVSVIIKISTLIKKLQESIVANRMCHISQVLPLQEIPKHRCSTCTNPKAILKKEQWTTELSGVAPVREIRQSEI